MYKVDGLCADHNNNKLLRVNGIDRKFMVVVLDRLRNEPVLFVTFATVTIMSALTVGLMYYILSVEHMMLAAECVYWLFKGCKLYIFHLMGQ